MGAKSPLCPRSSRLRSTLLQVSAVILIAIPASYAQPSGGPAKYKNNLAPYVSSPQRVVDRMLELANVKSDDTVFDLGCGDGRVLITAAQRFHARAVGIEISGKLVQKTNERIQQLGLQQRIKVLEGDILQADLTEADVVVMFLLTESNQILRPRLEKQLHPGARVVSYAFAIPGWKPKLVDKTDEHDGHNIYLYEIPKK